jgi:peptide/nickel transport system ATP-binding protein/oligopeptide transport system ATP-binding protein
LVLPNDKALLEVRHLKTYFYTEDGVAPAVDDVSFILNRGETIGIVGESGSGKSVTSMSIMRLVSYPPGRIVNGEILLDGMDLLKLSEREMQSVRGNRISMIFQEPMTSLNPVFTVGYQIEEVLRLHQKMGKAEARAKTIDMLRLVGISSPEQRYKEYPHQLSGGMRQRVMIAIALACNPELLIADEPTTALDVTIQAQILELMKGFTERLGTSIILITHDLGVVSEVAQKVMVMYAGQIVEYADTKTIFSNPLHPYTCGLLGSLPSIDQTVHRLQIIEGLVPSLYDLPKGCSFNPRCSRAQEVCRNKRPELIEFKDGHKVRCLLASYSDGCV